MALLVPVAQSLAADAGERAVQQSVSYVFANELGSGIYRIDGRSLQVYRLRWSRVLREADDSRPGVRVVAPLTFGFLDFDPEDLLDQGIPSRIDSFSITPGLEVDYVFAEDWHAIPYVRAGFSIATSKVSGWLAGTGVRLERRVRRGAWNIDNHHELALAAVAYTDDLPDDHFLRLRQGIEFRRILGSAAHQDARGLEAGMYAIADVVAHAPSVPIAGSQRQPLQFEIGAMLAPQPQWRIWRVRMPRLGVGYRFAGNLSGWRVVLGAPF
jgi:hypothetical protein